MYGGYSIHGDTGFTMTPGQPGHRRGKAKNSGTVPAIAGRLATMLVGPSSHLGSCLTWHRSTLMHGKKCLDKITPNNYGVFGM